MGAIRRVGQERTHAFDLLALNIDKEHVRRIRRYLDRELLEQARLQRTYTDDEESAEPDGQQDHARLVSRPRQVQHRVPQRKRPRSRERRHHANQQATGELQREGQHREPDTNNDADPNRGRLPGGDADERQRNGDHRADPQPIAPARRGFVAQEQRRFHGADPQ